MERNGIANIKMMIDQYNNGGEAIENLHHKIEGQLDILMQYMEDSAKVIEKNRAILEVLGVEAIRLPYWHETKEKLGVK